MVATIRCILPLRPKTKPSPVVCTFFVWLFWWECSESTGSKVGEAHQGCAAFNSLSSNPLCAVSYDESAKTYIFFSCSLTKKTAVFHKCCTLCLSSSDLLQTWVHPVPVILTAPLRHQIVLDGSARHAMLAERAATHSHPKQTLL